MIDYYQYFSDMFGEGAPGMEALTEQLIAQWWAALDLLQTLDPLGLAFQNLLLLLNEAGLAIGFQVGYWEALGIAIGITIDIIIDVTDFIGKLGQRIEETTGSISDLITEWNLLLQELMGPYNQVMAEIQDLVDFINALTFMGLDLGPYIDQIMGMINAWLMYLGTLDPNSQAYADAWEALQELLDLLEELGYPIELDIGYGGGASPQDIIHDLSLIPQYLSLHILPPIEDINIISTMISELHQNIDISLGIDNYTLVWDMVSNLTRDRTVDMTMTMDMESYGEIISLLDAIPRSINIGVTMTPPDLEAGPMPEAARISASNIVSSESGKGNTESVRILQPIIHEATPETWAEIVDTKVDPRFSETEKYTESGGYFR